MKEIMRVDAGAVKLELNPETLLFNVEAAGHVWRQDLSFCPHFLFKDGGELAFHSADTIRHEYKKSGVGEGILSCYEWDAGHLPLDSGGNGAEGAGNIGCESDGGKIFSFETLVWIEQTTGAVHFELIPGEGEIDFVRVYWPGYFSFEKNQRDAYTVMPVLQGLLIPNTWQNETRKLPFDGQFCSSGAYMPWYGQVEERYGYIAICETPWDGGYYVDHPAGGPYTHTGAYFLPSLGKFAYRRRLRYIFLKNCDYNDLCKVYRGYAAENGQLVTLKEKAARNPRVDELIGSVVVHKGIKTHVSPDSAYYDREHPENNDVLIPFHARTREIERYCQKGVKKLYLHLDGWGAPGYDNQHPDYLPACPEAGGWEGLKELSDTLRECGYLFGLHDQYRDYYTDAATYDRDYALHGVDGTVFEMARWAGGRQNYLCATQAPYYVKRNFEEVLSHGIHLQASYLDVFTCNEPDECAHPRHRMTRKECLEYRSACFSYLWSRGILPSSEECTDWAMKELVFCHYGPYDFMLQRPGSPRRGVPVPLFNLVYHDCMILPWFMDRQPDGEDYMLYALLNGGAAYLDRDGAYPDTDGSFDSEADRKLSEEIERCAVVTNLQERVAKCEMVRHEFLDDGYDRQRTLFADGTRVTVDLKTGEYEIG
ncbi:MAG: DUF5696 domain-containing protein [Lachnospiraceae bacterium]|nr:DUF5696 domain-containing protein [Lachnospiraceae bacterium]